MSNELYHYGVLGMKWGVRKKKDTVLKRGARIQNISAEAPRDISKTNTLFVSNKRLDNLAYEGGYARQLKNLRGVQSVYKNDFIVTNEIRAPSQERAVKILMKMVKKDKKGTIRAVSKSIADINRLYGATELEAQRLESDNIQKLSKMGKKKLTTNMIAAANFALMSQTKDDDFKIRYIKTLAKYGYNALLDTNDMVEGGTERPLVLFNPQNNLRSAYPPVKLSESQIDLAIKKYESMTGRRAPFAYVG